MKESIEGFLLSLEKISKDIRIRELKVIEKTKSILKARLVTWRGQTPKLTFH